MARPRKQQSLTPEERLKAAQVPVEEQPYPLPEGWKWVRLGDVCSFIGGGTPDKAKPEFWNGDIPWASVKDIKGMYLYETKDCITKIGAENSATNIAKPGELIVVTRISPAKCIISKIKVAINQDLKIVKSKINTIFLYFYFCSFEELFLKKSSGTTVKGITIQKMNEAVFPYPPLAEQQRIVDRIEFFFARLDEAKAKAQAVLDSFEARKAAILHKAFSGELTARWRKEHGLTLESWENASISNLVKSEKNSLKAGPFGSALTKKMYSKSGYKIYGQEQVIAGDETIGDYYIDDNKYKELYSCRVQPNDILISLVGTVGKVLILSKNCKAGIINPRLIKISLDTNKILHHYFKYYFESDDLKNKYKKKTHGTTMDVLNLAIIKKLQFPKCSVEEQQEIVLHLDSLLERERQAKAAAETVLRQIDLMKKAILAKAFRGELGKES